MKNSLTVQNSNKKVVFIFIILFVTILLTFGILYNIRESKAPDKSEASQSNYDFLLKLPDDNNYPIYRLSNDNLTPECTDTNKSEEWVVNQWWNEYSLCLDTDNAP
ncbi:hypothetical protein GF362_02100, partial [Candidatus Dojkabacteria bacterium]|nr:hypothetical protein [Candidatus Dojkabacteria bacterium]